ncbi:helix-turn-helix domain-containing protein [Streptomyces sp. ODS28]|uniref:helix-turn-helix domain-containing protein n=1 Tax=Streptomyces sp. ODS28 TaxID=3136688 RepID=UPI0031ECF132
MARHQNDLPRLYEAAEVADALGCSEWWVKDQARRRRIPFIKSGGGYRFTKEHFYEALALLEERPAQGPVGGPEAMSARRPSSTSSAPVTRLRARRPRRARNAAA